MNQKPPLEEIFDFIKSYPFILGVYVCLIVLIFIVRMFSGSRYSCKYQINRIGLNLLDSIWIPIRFILRIIKAIVKLFLLDMFKFLFEPTGDYNKIKDKTYLLKEISKKYKFNNNWMAVEYKQLTHYICVNDYDVYAVTLCSLSEGHHGHPVLKHYKEGETVIVEFPNLLLADDKIYIYDKGKNSPIVIDLGDPDSLNEA